MILTCQGVIDIFGKKQELKEKLELNRHIIASKEPHLHSIYLQKDSVAAQIISNSGCFVLNLEDGEEKPCSKLLDCFCLGDSLECEVVESKELGDSILFVGKVVHKG